MREREREREGCGYCIYIAYNIVNQDNCNYHCLYLYSTLSHPFPCLNSFLNPFLNSFLNPFFYPFLYPYINTYPFPYLYPFLNLSRGPPKGCRELQAILPVCRPPPRGAEGVTSHGRTLCAGQSVSHLVSQSVSQSVI